jgi:hypothetical protein
MSFRPLHAFLVVLATLAVVFFWRVRGQRAAEVPATPVSPPVAKAAPVDSAAIAALPRALSWRAGEMLIYSVAVRSTVRIQRGGAPGGGEELRPLSFQGLWTLGVIAEEGSSAIVRATLQLEGVQMDEGKPAVELDQLEAVTSALRLPVFLRIARSGQVEALRLPPALEAQPAALAGIQTLVGMMQVSYAPEPQPSWEVSEQDGTGQYLARYELKGSGALHRRRGPYLSVASPKGAVPPGQELEVTTEGHGELGIEPEGWINRLGLREQIVIRQQGQGSEQQGSQTRIELTALGRLISRKPTGAEAGSEDWRAYPERPLSYRTPDGK